MSQWGRSEMWEDAKPRFHKGWFVGQKSAHELIDCICQRAWVVIWMHCTGSGWESRKTHPPTLQWFSSMHLAWSPWRFLEATMWKHSLFWFPSLPLTQTTLHVMVFRIPTPSSWHHCQFGNPGFFMFTLEFVGVNWKRTRLPNLKQNLRIGKSSSCHVLHIAFASVNVAEVVLKAKLLAKRSSCCHSNSQAIQQSNGQDED